MRKTEILALFVIVVSVSISFGQVSIPQPQLSAAEKQAVNAFQKRLKDYVKLRDRAGKRIAVKKPRKESTPEEIQNYRTALQNAVREDRSNAKAGDVFKPDIITHIRSVLLTELNSKDRQEVKEIIFEAETDGVPMRVNYPYPDGKELAQIPPTLLLRMPQLPEQLRYRFVGRHLLLMDKENDIIIDYTLNVLP